MLEEWLLEGVQLGRELRIGKWIAQILWFHLVLNAYSGGTYIYEGNVVGDSSDAKQFNGLHDEARVSRGVGSRKQANQEERVVSVRHSLLLHIMATQL